MNDPSTPPDIDFVRATMEQRRAHESLALELTQTPTAAGREDRVIERVRAWCAERSGVRCEADPAGNLVIERADASDPDSTPPMYITAHLDHPAFTLEARSARGELLLSFRGGVLDAYFRDAGVVLFASDGTPVRATILSTEGPADDASHAPEAKFLRTCVASVRQGDEDAAASLEPGDLGRWDLPSGAIEDTDGGSSAMGRVLRADACDDLAPLSAALCAFDLVREDARTRHVRLLLTRAEEVGFVGAIAACKHRTMPEGSRALLLEASRAFPESPVGGGPIVRVGDRANTFSPAMTAAITKLAEGLRKAEESRGKAPNGRAFRYQRKLMPGGVCEASAYLAYGYESTCVCLPLGNYHNMADLAAVADEKDEQAIANARVGREFVAMDDYHDLVTLLTAVALSLAESEPMTDRLDRLHRQRERILTDPTLFTPDVFTSTEPI